MDNNNLISEIRKENEVLLTPLSRYALRMISEKMYHDPYTFIRELIQNSDDAYSYKLPKKNKIIRFIIDSSDSKISVSNYGKPFDEKDVRQICTMLPSDKPPSQIGTLGLGFKSVFCICDEPRIHSGEYDFKITDYILPHEVERPVDMEKNETRFVLPLNTKIDTQKLKERLLSLDSEMVIFLNNISEINVIDIEEKQKLTIKRKKRKIRGYNVTRLIVEQEGVKTGQTYWWIFRKRFEVPPEIQKRMEEDIRKEMEEIYKGERLDGFEDRIRRKVLKFIEPSIAVQTHKDGRFSELKDARLFIFLPTEIITGLKFLVHAEFKPTADRNNIEENPVNEWLMKKAIDSICEFIEEVKKIRKRCTEFYKIVPVPNDSQKIVQSKVKDLIFNPICEGVLRYLRANETIYTDMHIWVQPNKVCVTEYKELRTLLSKGDLESNFGRSFFAAREILKVSPQLLEALSIRKIGVNDFVDFITKKSNIGEKPPPWFLHAYAILGKHVKKDSDELSMLKESEIILDSSRNLVSPNLKKVYLPSKEVSYELYPLFKEDISFVHDEALMPKEVKEKRKSSYRVARRFLQSVGVDECKPISIIKNVILRKFSSSEELAKLDENMRYEYVNFIREHYAELKKHREDLASLKQVLVIKADNGTYHKPDDLYLSKAYMGDENLEAIFGDIEGIHFVSEDYASRERMQNKSGKRAKRKCDWLTFLKDFGAHDKPRARYRDFGDEGWDYYLFKDKKWRAHETAYTAWKPEQIDYYLESEDMALFFQQLEDLVDANLKRRKALALLQVLNEKWRSYEREFKPRSYRIKRWYQSLYEYKPPYSSSYNSKPVPSGLQDLFKDSRWIPTTFGDFRRPSEVFLNKKELKRLMGNEVPYLAISIGSKEIRDFLGINTYPDFNAINKHLIQLCLKKRVSRKKVSFILERFKEPKNYADLLVVISDARAVNKHICKLINRSYKKLSDGIRDIEENGGKIEEKWRWWDRLKENIALLTESGRFMKPSEVFVPDHPILQDKLKDSNIPFVFGDYSLSKLFFEKIGVRFLSEAAKKRILEIPKESEEWVSYTRKIKTLIPHLKRLESYKKQSIGAWNYELVGEKFKVCIVPELEVKYVLDEKHATGAILEKVAYDENARTLYITKDASSMKQSYLHTYIGGELARLISPYDEKDLLHFISMLLNEKVEDMSELMDIHGIPRLTTDEGLLIEMEAPTVTGELPPVSPAPEEMRPPVEIKVEPIVSPTIEVGEEIKPQQIEVQLRAPSSEKVESIRKALRSESPPQIIVDSPQNLDEIVEETAKTLEEESEGHRIDLTRVFKPSKRISSLRREGSIRITPITRIISPKNWHRRIINGEEIFVEQGMEKWIPSIEKIREFKGLLMKIVEAMAGNPQTINICVAKKGTDGYNEDGQLFFNVAREDTCYRWFAVAARELAYNYSSACRINCYVHIKVMIDLIEKGLEKIHEIFPEFNKT